MTHGTSGATRLAWTLAAAWALLAACESPVIPKPEKPDVEHALTREALSDRILVDQLRRDWRELKRADLAPERRQAVIDRYNSRLETLMARLRYDVHREGSTGATPFQDIVDFTHTGLSLPSLRMVYEDILPAREVEFEYLKEHYAAPGLGVPLVGVVPADVARELQDKDAALASAHTQGTVVTLTAVLDFPDSPRNARPNLRFIPRLEQETIDVGKLRYQLAADLSAPMEIYWRLTYEDKNRFLGLLRPQKMRENIGLTSLQPYNPNKIPVVLTHGLLSDARTFGQLVNRLYVDPDIRNNFQFWYFNYPTGPAWVYNAAAYRAALAAVREKVDPKHRNRNWDNMVVVGHSMGGLITHYSQCVEPWNLLVNGGVVDPARLAELDKSHIDKPFEDPAMEQFRQLYFFKPVKAGMVVYFATPHRGAPMADFGIVRLLTGLIELPFAIVNETINMVTLNPDLFLLNPKQMTRWFTSVDQLSPEGYSIRGLQGLKTRDVPTFSVIGNRGRCGLLERSSDGVVPYWSSHINWGEEEFIVPESHSVQKHKDTAEYMKIILHEYLQEHPAIQYTRGSIVNINQESE